MALMNLPRFMFLLISFMELRLMILLLQLPRLHCGLQNPQMMKETEDIVHMNLDFLPLTTNAFIVEGNALELDWESVVSKYEVSYIMGNPPFVGARLMEQGRYRRKKFRIFLEKLKMCKI